MKILVRVTIVALLAVVLTGCFGRLQPVYNVNDMAVPVALQDASTSKIDSIIKVAVTGRGWRVEDVSPGVIKATLRQRTHEAIVNIKYSNKAYSIDYVSSQDLLYDGSQIHRNYNRWVKTLEQDINKEMYRASLNAS
ncbi:MAG: hypothetical protein V7701_03065 [Sneathiella sp.]